MRARYPKTKRQGAFNIVAWPMNRFDPTVPWQVRDLVIFFTNLAGDCQAERLKERKTGCQLHMFFRGFDFKVVMSNNLMHAHIEVIQDDRLFNGPELQIQRQKLATYFFRVFQPHVDEEITPGTFAKTLFKSMRQIAHKADICEAVVYAAFGRPIYIWLALEALDVIRQLS